MSELGFKLEQRGPDWVIVYQNSKTFFASAAERKLWQSLADERRKTAELEAAIRATITENLHLADGDACTLKRLKDAVGLA